MENRLMKLVMVAVSIAALIVICFGPSISPAAPKILTGLVGSVAIGYGMLRAFRAP